MVIERKMNGIRVGFKNDFTSVLQFIIVQKKCLHESN